MATGEAHHAKGKDGAENAKRWLEGTTRVTVPWINPHPIGVKKLSFNWLDGSPFSFDLGGYFVGGEIDGEEVFIESKNYSNANDQLHEYTDFLAKCYVAYEARPDRCDNFMWITWAAFGTTVWEDLRSARRVKEAVIKNAERALDVPKQQASDVVKDRLCEDVAERLWIIVLCDRQVEHLVLSPEHQGLIRGHIAEKRATPA